MKKNTSTEKSLIKTSQTKLVRVSSSIAITNKILKESETRISEHLYQTININGLEWMVENLNVKSFRNGEPIREAKSSDEWISCFENKIPAWCYYNNDHNNDNLGLLYNHFAFLNIQNIAPDNYRIPSRDEWQGLRKDIIEFGELNSFALKDEISRKKLNAFYQFNYKFSGLRHGIKDCEFYGIDLLTAHYENGGTPFYLHQKIFNGTNFWRINFGHEHGWYIRLIKDN